MLKKRKETSQATTLLKFFNRNQTEDNTRISNPPSGSSPSVVKHTVTHKALTKKEHQPRIKWSQEVIVIDSDDETQTQGPTSDLITSETKGNGKREKRKGNVDIDSMKRRRGQSPTKRSTSVIKDENIFVEGGTWLSEIVSPNCSETQIISEDRHVRICRKECNGKALSTLESGGMVECSASLSRRVVNVGSKNCSQDEWSTWTDIKDAELYSPKPTVKIERDDLPLAEMIDSCPVCGATFLDYDRMAIQEHVISCPSDQSVLNAASLFSCSRAPSPAVQPRQPKPPCKSIDQGESSNVFKRLMASHDEIGVWEEAQVHEDKNFKPTKNNRRQAPFYKVLTGMPIAVDAFRYGDIPGITAYFLTHAHSDHYTNLSSNWDHGPIYCSETTANLIERMLSVKRKWLKPLPMDAATEIPNTGGVKVTLIDANHCPGSCLFLFEGRQTCNAGDSSYKSNFVGSDRTFCYLHCGDFRACPRQTLHPAIRRRRLDTVYLDTTYLNPRYCFPPQPLVIAACAELARRIVKGESIEELEQSNAKGGIFQRWIKQDEAAGSAKKRQKDGDILVVVGTYSIGKERIVKAIAKALDTKVYCDARKTALLRCQDDPELHALLTNDPLTAGVHVVPLGQVASDRFKEYIARWPGRWARAVAFRPTGWTYTPPAGSDPMPPIASVIARAQERTFTYKDLKPGRNSTRDLTTYGVPYSEHSSFAELACFALSVDCTRVIATVNVGSAPARAKMQKWIERWDVERKKRRERGEGVVVKYRSLDYW